MLQALSKIIRDVANAVGLEAALHVFVSAVSEALSVEVCSVYLLDEPTNLLVLRAALGLERTAVDSAQLRLGEGLVGRVAASHEIFSSEDASLHPDYRHMRELGEGPFRALLIVPIVRHGVTMGVVVVQHRTVRSFSEEEVNFLATVCAQLSTVLGGITTANELEKPVPERGITFGFIRGIAASPGVTVGTLVAPAASFSAAGVPDLAVDGAEHEHSKFDRAAVNLDAELADGEQRLSTLLSADSHALFNVYRIILNDPLLIDSVRAGIDTGLTALASLEAVIAEQARQFEEMTDEYLRARAEDIRAIGQGLAKHLVNESLVRQPFPQRSVLIGEEVGLPRLAEVPPERLAGMICAGGSILSHPVVVARALGVPAVMGLEDLPVHSLDGRTVVIDGFAGQVWIDPPDHIADHYRRLEAEERSLALSLTTLTDLSPDTLDKVTIPLYANIGLAPEIERARRMGAMGVGLYRSEFAFMLRDTFPSEEEQFETYCQILGAFAPLPVTIRTLDVGGDKQLPYFSYTEVNPFLGWRGIRVTLDHPEIALPQLRALLRAHAEHGNLRILVPMISGRTEITQFKNLLRQAEDSVAVESPALGIMVEVPATLYQIGELAEEVDFVSIGTNDLTQYMLAVDRGNARVAGLYDSLHPAILRALRGIVATLKERGTPVSICGEIAGDPAATGLLVGMGVDSLSMAPSAIPKIKSVVRSLDCREMTALLAECTDMRDAAQVRARAYTWLESIGLDELVRAGH